MKFSKILLISISIILINSKLSYSIEYELRPTDAAIGSTTEKDFSTGQPKVLIEPAKSTRLRLNLVKEPMPSTEQELKTTKQELKNRKLYSAIQAEDVAAVRAAIAEGASIQENGPDYETPLFQALGGNNLEIIDILLKAGANFGYEAGSGYGLTAIRLAARSKSLEIEKINLLLAAGANINLIAPLYNETVLDTVEGDLLRLRDPKYGAADYISRKQKTKDFLLSKGAKKAEDLITGPTRNSDILDVD